MELVNLPMRIVAFGEGMIEISGGIGATGRIAFAGDVLNVAISLARLGHRPTFLTALGLDSWSDDLVAAWAAEGVDTDLIARHPSRFPGLYGVTVDDAGERSFTYWRDQSAARGLFALPVVDALLAEAAQARLLFLSGITLSLYDKPSRRRIVELAAEVRRRGGDVTFDGNYRPRGWANPDEACAAFAALAPYVSIALPTFEDETLIFGETVPQLIAERWHKAGAREVVVKLGAEGAFVSAGNEAYLVPTARIQPVDTSGAGDAFNAGYLSARINGLGPRMAAMNGHKLAGMTIRYPGAIAPRGVIVQG